MIEVARVAFQIGRIATQKTSRLQFRNPVGPAVGGFEHAGAGQVRRHVVAGAGDSTGGGCRQHHIRIGGIDDDAAERAAGEQIRRQQLPRSAAVGEF